ncbi:hypothetical protein ACWD4N_45795 [Streptomyces sp. NPDC002586]
MNPISTHSPHNLDTGDLVQARRATASTITDPDLDALYDERDGLLRLLLLLLIAGAGTT